MGDVFHLDSRRAARQRAAAVTPTHPSLRFLAGHTWWLAHRRDEDRPRAACGAPGALVVATPGVPLCPDCYPS